MNLRLISALALVLAAPAAAQQSLPTPQPTTQVPEEGLSGAVSDDSDWQDLGIAIPAFSVPIVIGAWFVHYLVVDGGVAAGAART